MEKASELQMTAEEILRDYKAAKNKAEQVQILADLNLCSKELIKRILVEGGVDPRQLPRSPRKKPPAHTANEVQREQKKKEDAERRSAEAAVIGDVTREALFFYKGSLEGEAKKLLEEYEKRAADLKEKIAAAERALELLG